MPKKKPPAKPRIEPPRLLAPNGGYVKDPRYALGATARHSSEPKDPKFYDTENEVPPEPEAVDKETQKWITDEAKERFVLMKDFESTDKLRSEDRRLRALLATSHDIARRRGIDIRSDVRVIERRLEAISKKLGLKEAA